MSGNPGAVVRALMTGAIDYAGLFPPAALSMRDAVRRYESCRCGTHAWMLGRFIVPVARLEELVTAFATLPSQGAGVPWLLSVIATASDATALAAFNGRYGRQVRIDTVEVPPGHEADFPALTALLAKCTVFAEVDAASDPAPIIGALARYGVGAKIRTGGMTADAFPTAEAVARFIVACRDAGVRFKATAGLHHAWRAEYPLTYEAGCPRTTMFGFLNLLLAAAAAGAGAAAADVAAILGERSPSAITFDAAGARIGTRVLDVAAITSTRANGMTSFGSCSFDEPVAELAERGLL